MTKPIGAHVSIAGGIEKAFDHAKAMQAEAIQIFTRSPNQWRLPELSKATIELFKQKRQEYGSPPVVAHDIYLHNLASPKADVESKSHQGLIDELNRCHKLGLDGLVVHLGAHGHKKGDRERHEDNGIHQYAKHIKSALEQTEQVPILLETCAGQGTTLGYTLEHIFKVMELNDHHPRLKICIDTCHIFVAGYGIDQPENWHKFIHQIDTQVGAERVALIHANDAKHKCGSKKDRHQHIAQGYIGEAAFRAIVQDATIGDVPIIIETPDMKTEHAHNIARLKSYRS